MDGVFWGHSLAEIRKSSRVLGLSVQILRSKAETKQRRPLTVRMVRCLVMFVVRDVFLLALLVEDVVEIVVGVGLMKVAVGLLKDQHR